MAENEIHAPIASHCRTAAAATAAVDPGSPPKLITKHDIGR